MRRPDIEKLRGEIETLSAEALRAGLREALAYIEELEQSTDMTWIDDAAAVLDPEAASFGAEMAERITTQGWFGELMKLSAVSWEPKDTGWGSELAAEFPNVDFQAEAKSFVLFWGEGRRKLKNWRLAWRNWVRKASAQAGSPKADGGGYEGYVTQ